MANSILIIHVKRKRAISPNNRSPFPTLEGRRGTDHDFDPAAFEAKCLEVLQQWKGLRSKRDSTRDPNSDRGWARSTNQPLSIRRRY